MEEKVLKSQKIILVQDVFLHETIFSSYVCHLKEFYAHHHIQKPQKEM